MAKHSRRREFLKVSACIAGLAAFGAFSPKLLAQDLKQTPRDSKKGLFADGLWNKIIIEGVMIGILTLLAFSIGNKLYGIKVARTMAFVSLGMLELVHSFNIKSEQSIFEARSF